MRRMETMPVVILWGRNTGPAGGEGGDLSLNRFAHRMHSRFLEQRTISQGSIYAAAVASAKRRSLPAPTRLRIFSLSRKYIYVDLLSVLSHQRSATF